MIARLKELLLTNRSTEQTVAKNTVWLTISQLGARLIRAAFMVYLARLVGAEGYGLISYALSLAALVSSVTDLGIGGVITREGSRHHEDQMRYLATGAAAKAGLVIVAAVVLGAWALLGAPSAVLMPLVIAIVAFDAIRDLATALFRAQEKMQIEAWVQVVTNGAIALLGLAAAIAFGSPAWVLGAYAAGCAIGAITALWPLRTRITKLHTRYDRTLVRNLIRSSWTFGVVGLVGGIMLNADAIMLAWFRPAAEVGYYAAAQRIVQILYVLPLPLASALFPVVARIADDKQRFRDVVEGSAQFLLVMGTGFAISLLAASGAIIRLLYGSDFEPASGSLAIMSLTLIPSFVAASLANALFAIRRERALIGYAVLAVVANVVFNFVFIPTFGGPGSAIATLLAQSALLTYLMYVLRKEADVRVLSDAPEIAVGVMAGIGVAVAMIVIGINGIIAGAFAFAAYTATLYFLNDPAVVTAVTYARRILKS